VPGCWIYTPIRLEILGWELTIRQRATHRGQRLPGYRDWSFLDLFFSHQIGHAPRSANKKLSVVVHACNSSTQEAEAGGS
jgi:hypothetical protein